MPCSYYLPGEEEAMQRDKYKKLLDEATHELDVLREKILAVMENLENSPVPPWVQEVREKQIEHRKMDLERLTATFTDQNGRARKGYGDLMKKVRNADPTKPLEPQLGFDPDEY